MQQTVNLIIIRRIHNQGKKGKLKLTRSSTIKFRDMENTKLTTSYRLTGNSRI